MAGILRGEIHWADLNPVKGEEQSGLRPIFILSQDVFNEHSGTVIAVAITSQCPKAGFPLTLELTGARLPKQSWVRIGQVRTLSIERLSGKIGKASPSDIEQVVDGLKELIGG